MVTLKNSISHNNLRQEFVFFNSIQYIGLSRKNLSKKKTILIKKRFNNKQIKCLLYKIFNYIPEKIWTQNLGNKKKITLKLIS